MKTRTLPANSDLLPAILALRSGEVVALPTETVYGLAADALSADAVVKIFEAKERPRFDPLIIHLPEAEWLKRITDVPAVDERLVSTLISRFWPGPLTLVLPRSPSVPDIVTAGLETVAVRMSAHPVFQAVIREVARPLAAPSANRFGRLSPTDANHVFSELDGRIPFIVDGGPTLHGIESTIVAVREGALEILRHGPVTVDKLAEFAELRPAQIREYPEAPGQLRSHYAPRTPLVLTHDLASFVPPAGARWGALVLRPVAPEKAAEVRTLSKSGDLREAAANLFRHLRELDEAGLDLIVAEEIPETGLGRAIMDRLRRAAAV
ncbi:MAG: L-threonylcarbamoyladenylate synthase [Chthoniobacterales bacterium]